LAAQPVWPPQVLEEQAAWPPRPEQPEARALPELPHSALCRVRALPAV
jgi:hypothetical protein